jgi:hypothetical protein
VLGSSQIILLVLGECSQQENWEIVTAKYVQYTCTAALASPAKSDANFADAAAAWHNDTATWLIRDQMDDCIALVG